MKIHDQFEAADVIERYVRDELGNEERRAFEEHFLDCGTCFEKVQSMERFVAGVRYASESARLATRKPARSWLIWAFAFGFAVLFVLSGIWIATLLHSISTMTGQKQALARELQSAQSQLAARNRVSAGMPIANLPLAILDSTRSADSVIELTVPSSSPEFALWIQLDPESRYHSLDVEIADNSGHTVEPIRSLAENPYGALVLALPSTKFPSGSYTVLVFRRNPHMLLGQYVVKISER